MRILNILMLIVFLSTVFLFCSHSENEIAEDKIQMRNGVFYAINEKKPYTGKAVSIYDNGQKMSERTFKDGKEDGVSTYWYKNGRKMSESTFKDGKKNGLCTEWYKEGKKMSEFLYKDDKMISSKKF